MLTTTYIKNINVVLDEIKINKVTSNSEDFNNWMNKIKNIYRFDNKTMCAAYNRVEFPHLKIPFVQNLNFKHGRYS